MMDLVNYLLIRAFVRLRLVYLIIVYLRVDMVFYSLVFLADAFDSSSRSFCNAAAPLVPRDCNLHTVPHQQRSIFRLTRLSVFAA